MPVVLACKRLRQEGYSEFQIGLGYRGRLTNRNVKFSSVLPFICSQSQKISI